MTDRIALLYEFSRSLHRLDTAQVMQTIVSYTAMMADAADACLVALRSDQAIETIYLLDPEAVPSVWDPSIERGLAYHVCQTQHTVVIDDIATDVRWAHAPGLPRRGSAIGVPMFRDQRLFGVLMLIHTRIEHFNESLVSLLEEAALVASLSLANALDHHQTRYRRVFQDAVVPMLLIDTRGMIIDINQEATAFLGLQRENVLDKPVTVLHRDRPPMLEPVALRALKRDEETSFRTMISNSHHEEIPVVVRARRVRVDSRELIELVEQDITAETELQQLRRDLSAMVYHDLRNPLQTVTMSIQRLNNLLINNHDPSVAEMLHNSLRSARQLSRMIDSLLDIQRLEEGQSILNAEDTDLRTLLADCVSIVMPLTQEADVALKFELPSDLPPLHVDSDMIGRVIINLIENAVKYIPKGGRITLGAKVVSEGVRISVSDDGPGIPQNMTQRIFEKFTRVRQQDTPKGLGLGLAFCRLAVEAHGGEIWVESEPGKGAEFVFTLPSRHRDEVARAV